MAQAFPFAMPRLVYLSTVAYMFKLASPVVLSFYEQFATEAQVGGTDHRLLLGQILTDYMFTCANRNASAVLHEYKQLFPRHKRGPLYLYHFTQPSDFITEPAECRGRACHMSELPFVFNRTQDGAPEHGEFSESEGKLTATIMSYWISFAVHGHPNKRNAFPGAAHRPYWPEWSPAAPVQLQIAWPPMLEGSACDVTCVFWDSLGYRF